jgi:aminoglycoside phosphotransferase family enzyme/predicted kinase
MRQPPQDSQPPLGLGTRLAELLDPAAFPHPVTQLQGRETPISWVLLTGVYAYKIKKPVHFEFIDASSLQRRHFLCAEELRLNRRFAPDLYVDVVSIVEQHGRLRIDAPGTPLEYAVRMRQFAASAELANQLAQALVTREDMAALGRYVAKQHRAAPVAVDEEFGRPQLIRAQLEQNFEPLRAASGDADHLRLLLQLERWSRERIHTLTGLVSKRRHCGQVRECHGDLHAGNIVRWNGPFLPFDCLEFDPRLRWIDVISDVAFLFMDLLSHTRPDLAYVFLTAYLEDSGDYEALRLLPLYSVYRALVRAKVEALGVAIDDPAAARKHQDQMNARLNTAAELISEPAPALLLMHGVTASGKSWVSEQLIGALGAVRMRSDLERRRLAISGSAPAVPGIGEGPYSDAARKLVYARLLECAESSLTGGYHAIIDATFLARSDRQMFAALAQRRHCPLLIISCCAGRQTLTARLDLRSRRAADPSEATLAVLDSQLGAAEPLDKEELVQTVLIDTESDTAISGGIRRLQAVLQSSPLPSLDHR